MDTGVAEVNLNDAPTIHEAREQAQDAIAASIRAFAAWVVVNWKIEPTREAWMKASGDKYPGDKYVAGHTAAIESIADAVDVFLDEA